MEPTLDALEETLAKILPPDFELGFDKNGQLIILTGLKESEDGILVPLDEIEVPFDFEFEEMEEEEEIDEEE